MSMFPAPDPTMIDPAMGAPPPAEPSITSSDQGTPSDLIRTMIQVGQTYMTAQDDDQALAEMANIVAKLQSRLSKEQKENDAAMGSGPSQAFLRRRAAELGQLAG